MKRFLSLLFVVAVAAALALSAHADLDPNENLALGKTPLVVNNQDGYPAEYALDADSESCWRAVENPSPKLNEEDGTFAEEIYFGVDFGMEMTFDKITIEFSVDRPAGDETGYKIQVSEDGKKWTDAKDAKYDFAEFTAAWQEVADHTVDTITFKKPVTTQYVRALFLKPCINLKSIQTVYEFNVYDTTGKANPAYEEAKAAPTPAPTETPAPSEPTSSETSVVPPTVAPQTSSIVSAAEPENADHGSLPLILGIVAAVLVVGVAAAVVIVKKKK